MSSAEPPRRAPVGAENADISRAEYQQLQQELERTQQALEAARTETNAAHESKERFLSQVAHELRTPLSAIVLWSSLIEDEKISDPAQLRHAIDAIRTSAEEQRTLIDNLLEISRIIAGKIQLEFKTIDLSAIVQNALEAFRAVAAQKSIAIEAPTPTTRDATIRGDASRLERAVTNLLSNAVKFTPSGGRVRVELHFSNDSAEISVSDSGPGFTPESLPKMLSGSTAQPNQRRATALTSYGLGLPIAKRIAELHGGALSAVSSGAGQGSTFSIRLPQAERAPSAAQPNATNPLLRGRRFLVVEPDSQTRHTILSTLTAAGAVALGADNVPAAFEELERAAPDTIICAEALPTMDGPEFIDQIRAAHTSGLRALALITSTDSAASISSSTPRGFDATLRKPVQADQLIEVLLAMAI